MKPAVLPRPFSCAHVPAPPTVDGGRSPAPSARTWRPNPLSLRIVTGRKQSRPPGRRWTPNQTGGKFASKTNDRPPEKSEQGPRLQGCSPFSRASSALRLDEALGGDKSVCRSRAPPAPTPSRPRQTIPATLEVFDSHLPAQPIDPADPESSIDNGRGSIGLGAGKGIRNLGVADGRADGGVGQAPPTSTRICRPPEGPSSDRTAPRAREG